MKYFPLIWAGICRKRGRAILTVLSIANAFLLFGLLQGFVAGLDDTIAAAHADVLITANRVSRAESLPIALLPRIETVPGVRKVSPLLQFHGTYGTPTQFVPAYAVDPRAFAVAYKQLSLPQALIDALVKTKSGALIPSTVASQLGWKVGDRVPLNSLFWRNRDGSTTWPLDIVGVFPASLDDPPLSRAVLLNYDYADQARTTAVGTSSFFLVRVVNPLKGGEVGAAIDKLFSNSSYETKTASERQLAQDTIKRIGDVSLIVRLVMSAVFFALLFSVGAVMMQSISERTPEFAVMKTLGFADAWILALILAEALLICVASAALGLGLAVALMPLVRTFVGFDISAGSVLFLGLGLAVLLALVTGLLPALRGMRLQIVDALAGR